MAGPSPYADTENANGVGADNEATTGTPRWVKVFGIIALVLVLLLVIVLLVGGGNHGPARHLPADVVTPAALH